MNQYLRTSAENVYAVGDAIEFPHPVSGEPWLNYLAGPANTQARIVADNMVFGDRIAYEGSIGTSIAKVFDLTVGSTGLPGKKLKQLNILVPHLHNTLQFSCGLLSQRFANEYKNQHSILKRDGFSEVR